MGDMRRINKGDADSYYIRNSHPAIIDRDTFAMTQALIAKSTFKPRENNESPFRGKLRCTCGRSYYYKKAKHRDYWECSGRFDLTEPCANPIVYDDELNAAWERLCLKLRDHADDILTPCLVQFSALKDAMNGGELAELERQEKELRQKRYVLCRLCSENCITHEKLFESETEIELRLAEIHTKMERSSHDIDETAEQIELLHKLVTAVSSQRLLEMITERINIVNGTACFELKGGLKLKEVL